MWFSKEFSTQKSSIPYTYKPTPKGRGVIMTIYIKEKTINKHNISIYQNKFESVYHVRDIEIGYNCADSDLIYPTFEKAKSRFYALCSKHKRGL